MCYNIGVQESQGDAGVDEWPSQVVAFGTTLHDTTIRHDRHGHDRRRQWPRCYLEVAVSTQFLFQLEQR